MDYSAIVWMDCAKEELGGPEAITLGESAHITLAIAVPLHVPYQGTLVYITQFCLGSSSHF